MLVLVGQLLRYVVNMCGPDQAFLREECPHLFDIVLVLAMEFGKNYTCTELHLIISKLLCSVFSLL